MDDRDVTVTPEDEARIRAFNEGRAWQGRKKIARRPRRQTRRSSRAPQVRKM